MGRPKTDRTRCYLLWLTAEEDARLTELEEASGRTRRDILGILVKESSLTTFRRVHSRAQAPRQAPTETSLTSGTAEALGARVRAAGARRTAVELSTGKVVEEGRTRR